MVRSGVWESEWLQAMAYIRAFDDASRPFDKCRKPDGFTMSGHSIKLALSARPHPDCWVGGVD
jgi:hypothetical protein